jgi:ABC-type lipopolysaccharide export system ATPase subunit
MYTVVIGIGAEAGLKYVCPSEVLTEGTSQFLANDDEAKRIHLGESFSLG